MKEVNKDNFSDEVLNQDGFVIVDFNADWCGPCQMLKPILDEIRREREDIKIVSVNVDKEEELSERFDILSIPTLIIFKDGKEINRSVGFRPIDDIEEMMEEI